MLIEMTQRDEQLLLSRRTERQQHGWSGIVDLGLHPVCFANWCLKSTFP